MDESTRLRLLNSIEETIRRELPKTEAGKSAEIQCSSCKKFYLLSDVQLSQDCSQLYCQSCITKANHKALISKPAQLMKLPETYVFIAILTAVLFWLSGVGNPSIESLVEKDLDKEWKKQDYTLLVLRQAHRVRKRMNRLIVLNRKHALDKWATLGNKAFFELQKVSKGQKDEHKIIFGRAFMLVHVDPQEAENLLLEIENVSHGFKNEYLLLRAKAAIALNKKNNAIEFLNLIVDSNNEGATRYPGQHQ